MRYSKKKEVSERWGGIVLAAKQAYQDSTGKSDFYKTGFYKDLNRRRKRALYRYDNRDKISQQKREYRERVKKAGTAKPTDITFSGAAIDAARGARGRNDMAAIKAIMQQTNCKFVGHLIVTESSGGLDVSLHNKKYLTLPTYKNAVSMWIQFLFSKDNGYLIFNSTITRRMTYDKQSNTLFHTTIINIEPDGQ